MDLKTHIKNHQILWGSGIGFVIFVSFIGGMVLVNSKPWESESSLTNSSNPSSANSGSQSSESEIEEVPLPAQNTVITGKITKVDNSNITVSPVQTQDSRTLSIPQNTPITLYTYKPDAPKNNIETQSLSPNELRTGDRVDVYITEDTQNIKKIKITSTSPDNNNLREEDPPNSF